MSAGDGTSGPPRVEPVRPRALPGAVPLGLGAWSLLALVLLAALALVAAAFLFLPVALPEGLVALVLGAAVVVLALGLLAFRGVARGVRLTAERRALTEDLMIARHEAELARQTADAAILAQAELVTRLSHDVRTPLNGVLGMTELLLGGSLRTEERFFADAAHQAGRTLLGVVNDILDFARLEAGKVTIERAPFAVEQVLEEVLAQFGAAAAKKGLLLTHRVDPQLPPRLLGDALRVRQVLTNLVAHALKVTEKGEIELVVSPGPNPGSERFLVRDTSPGLDAFARARLFQRFDPADPSVTSSARGRLGLAIVEELVDLMGGTVAVESQVGEGTQIAFTLNLDAAGGLLPGPGIELAGRTVLTWARHPAHLAQLEAWLTELGGRIARVKSSDELARYVTAGARLAVLDGSAAPDLAGLSARHPSLRIVAFDAPGHFGSQPGPVRRMSTPLTRTQLVRALSELDERGSMDLAVRGPGLRSGLEGARILVADDDAVTRTVLRGMLGRLGVSPVLVEDGASALTAMVEQRFDLALLDAELPDLDGLAVAKQLRLAEGVKGVNPQVIVALTTHALETERARCLAAGVTDVLTKPVSLATLESCLTRWVRRVATRDLPRSAPAS